MNCLAIIAGNCDFNDTFGADFSAASYAELEGALTTKIGQELTASAAVPEPSTLGLIGLGLLGLGVMRRRRQPLHGHH